MSADSRPAPVLRISGTIPSSFPYLFMASTDITSTSSLVLWRHKDLNVIEDTQLTRCEDLFSVFHSSSWHDSEMLPKRRDKFYLLSVMYSCCNCDSVNVLPGADKSLARTGRKQARKHVRDAHDFNNVETRGADKSLARTGRKQARKHVRDAHDFNNVETRGADKSLARTGRKHLGSM